MLSVTNVTVGPIQTNCWLLSDTQTGKTVVVDPGDSPELILAALSGKQVETIVLTHGHDDHRAALPAVEDATSAEVVAHERDAACVYLPLEPRLSSPQTAAQMLCAFDEGRSVTQTVTEGDSVFVGGYEFEVIHTPGHTPGSMCLYCAAAKVLVTGDTLFAGGRYGRTDFEGGSWVQMEESLGTKFARIPGDVAVYPGHGPTSTLARERALNPYLR